MRVRVRQIYSNQYDVVGFVGEDDTGFNVVFTYRYKRKEFALEGLNSDSSDEEMKTVGLIAMESYIKEVIENLPPRKTMLHYWYVDEVIEKDGEKWLCAHGIVSGHVHFVDSAKIWTSQVSKIEMDEEHAEALIYTEYDVFHCPFSYCRFKKQDQYPQLIPNYEEMKNQYQGTIIDSTIEPGNILLVISNFDHYYFNDLYYKKDENSERVSYYAYPHVGMTQDSYLIMSEEEEIDIRYFTHWENIEFYSTYTNGVPLFIENIGDIVLCAQTKYGVIRLEPGERKEVTKENVEAEEILLSNGDLYSAGFVE